MGIYGECELFGKRVIDHSADHFVNNLTNQRGCSRRLTHMISRMVLFFYSVDLRCVDICFLKIHLYVHPTRFLQRVLWKSDE